MTKCLRCGTKIKSCLDTFGGQNFFKIHYCPKCENVESVMPPIQVFRGIVLEDIDEKIGEFKFRITHPDQWAKREIIVQNFPKTVKVRPELKHKDEVIVAGFMTEGSPFAVVLMRNITMGTTSEFIANQIRLKRGFLISFTLKNPILTKAEEMMDNMAE